MCVPTACASGRSGADPRGEGVAGGEPGSCPVSLAETDQPRGGHTPLSGVTQQGQPSNDTGEAGGKTAGMSVNV